jgi:hypothetical protein
MLCDCHRCHGGRGVEGSRNPLSVLVHDVSSRNLSLDACVELYSWRSSRFVLPLRLTFVERLGGYRLVVTVAVYLGGSHQHHPSSGLGRDPNSATAV